MALPDLPHGPRAVKLSGFEKHSLTAGGMVVFLAAIAAFFSNGPGGLPRTIGLAGLGMVAICGLSRGLRLYQAGTTAALPTSVARVAVRIEPARGFTLTTVTLALLLPLAAAVTFVALVEFAWLVLAGVLLLGCAAAWGNLAGHHGRPQYALGAVRAEGLIERLCMRADIRVPEIVVEHGAVASAWTVGGRIHLTTELLRLLDDAELEGVLAHEVAHLARRDAAVMEICSAPSRVLLRFAAFVTPRLLSWTGALLKEAGQFGCAVAMGLWLVAALGIPPAFLIGWVSRLSVLGMSRAREFAADAAATTLTGRPSALASALMKLEHQREWTPRSDLRQVEALAVLCIVGAHRSRLGRLFSTHPPTSARVKRLEETESRIQAGPYAG